MLNLVKEILTAHNNHEAFFNIVGQHFPPQSDNYNLIDLAYQTSKEAFRPINREGNGERYFEHLRSVALILMLHLRITDAEIIAAALLHDIVEDIESWTHERVTAQFGQKIASLVWYITKPPVSEYNDDKEARNRAYHQRLNAAPRNALIIKLCDRLHNVMTLWGLNEEKQRRKVRETQDFYLPLAEKITILIHELEAALNETTNSWDMDT